MNHDSVTSRFEVSLRPMAADDAEPVLRIYQEGIDTGHATFAPAAPSWQGWDRTHLRHSRIVAVDEFGAARTPIPLPTSGPGAIPAGSTWTFQFWYSDILPAGAGFNLSDSLRIRFCN